ncbi:MAG: TMEM175 family protein [Tepidisphaeraceae bacterium]
MEPSNDTARLEAFSDGVFSVAITLLAFVVKIPFPADLKPGQTLGQALAAQWPIYLAYLTSFLTILVMWMNHHRLFKMIRRTTRPLFIFNGLLLMFITLVPYPTELMATYLRHPDAKIAAAVYSGTYLMISFCFNGIWRYAKWDRHLIGEHVSDEQIKRLHQQYRFGPLYYLIAFLASFWSMPTSAGICLLLAVYWALPAVPFGNQQ